MTTPQIIHATFENGLFRPDEVPNLPPQARVTLIIGPTERSPQASEEEPNGVEADTGKMSEASWEQGRAARLAALEAFNRLCLEHPIKSGAPYASRDELYDRG